MRSLSCEFKKYNHSICYLQEQIAYLLNFDEFIMIHLNIITKAKHLSTSLVCSSFSSNRAPLKARLSLKNRFKGTQINGSFRVPHQIMSFHGALKELEDLESQLRDTELQILQVETKNAVLRDQLKDKNQQIRDARQKLEDLNRIIQDEDEKIQWIDQTIQAKEKNTTY